VFLFVVLLIPFSYEDQRSALH